MRVGTIVVVMLATVLATRASALDSSSWPATVDEAAHDMVSRLSYSDKVQIKRMTREDLIPLHLSLGLRIRNQYGLWSGNEKLMLSACGKPCHPDDASAIIIEAMWRELRK